MLLNVYAIRDRATDQFSTPMFMVSNGQAIRHFADEINRNSDSSQLHNHPEDFDLYNLGTYDTDTGAIDSKRPQQIAIGKDHFVKAN